MRNGSWVVVGSLVVAALVPAGVAWAQAAPPAAAPVSPAAPAVAPAYPAYPPYPGYGPYPGYPPVAASPPPAAPPAPEKKLGVGYKIGNGWGFLGADLIVAPVEHLAFDLQINYLSYSASGSSATGVGYAPAVQGRLFGGQRSTPYLAVGWLHGSLKLDNVTSAASGAFVNAGYEWRWNEGLGIILGGGLAHLNQITASDGVVTITREGGWFPSIEAGVRFMFL